MSLHRKKQWQTGRQIVFYLQRKNFRKISANCLDSAVSLTPLSLTNSVVSITLLALSLTL